MDFIARNATQKPGNGWPPHCRPRLLRRGSGRSSPAPQPVLAPKPSQIPGQATICGDIRVTPFYNVHEVGGRGRLGLSRARPPARGRWRFPCGCAAGRPRARAPHGKRGTPAARERAKRCPLLPRAAQVIRKVKGYVDEINQNPDILARGQRGPHSK